jgi:hypothetical protein
MIPNQPTIQMVPGSILTVVTNIWSKNKWNITDRSHHSLVDGSRMDWRKDVCTERTWGNGHSRRNSETKTD